MLSSLVGACGSAYETARPRSSEGVRRARSCVPAAADRIGPRRPIGDSRWNDDHRLVAAELEAIADGISGSFGIRRKRDPAGQRPLEADGLGAAVEVQDDRYLPLFVGPRVGQNVA